MYLRFSHQQRYLCLYSLSTWGAHVLIWYVCLFQHNPNSLNYTASAFLNVQIDDHHRTEGTEPARVELQWLWLAVFVY